ncbi:MAG TPA: tetratricopeptide repeat protein [Candidatus Melainabacteria bacterium]|nr:tetratricopeptide repeat protein [Candidatus Melainabacteria bacterium]
MFAGNKRDSWEELCEAGQRYYLKGQFNEAQKLYTAALVAAKKARSGTSADVAQIYSRLGDLHCESQEFERAELCFRNALVEYENLEGDYSVDICIALKRISEICRMQSKNRQASNLAGRSQKLLEAKIRLLEKTFQESA